MVRTLKNRRQNRYQYDKNRKTLKKKLKSTGKILCNEIKSEIDGRKSLAGNITEMGLIYDVNGQIGTKNTAKNNKNYNNKRRIENYPKQHVSKGLEKSAKELRESKFRLPKNTVKILSYYIDKYGLNYKAMVKDPKNYNQETWRQFRQKIRKFMSIPDQFAEFLEERNLLEEQIDESNVKWKETNTDIEDE